MAQTLRHDNDYLSLIYLFLKHGIFEKWKQNEEQVVLGVKALFTPPDKDYCIAK